MELASVIERTHLIDPAGNELEQVIEHRTDPLTGNVASINTALGEKAKAFLGTADLELLNDLQEKSRAGCPFCNAAEKGTRYPPEVVREGQLRVGTALAMPNLFSKGALDSVVILDPRKHVLFPSRLGRDALADALKAAAELVRRARRNDPSLVHHLAGMNFLNPAGSSVPHPHLQLNARAVPFSAIARAVNKSEEYRERTGRNFWTVLLERESESGQRTVGRTGDVEWVAAFAPAHQREIWGVLRSKATLAEITEAEAEAFADGISRVITFYEETGTHPFNFAFFSSPDASSARSWALQVRICSRPALRPLYTNYDTWFGPKLAGDDVHTEAPERYAEALRARW